MKRLSLLAVACIAACAVAQTEPPSLIGTRWVGVVDAGLDADVTPRLEVVAGRVQG